MSFRFRKSFKLAPGVKINLNKKSSSITFGKKGVHKTYSSTGKTTNSMSVPGTGIYYTQTSSNKSSKISKQSVAVVPSRTKSVICIILCFIFLFLSIKFFNDTNIISLFLCGACVVLTICMYIGHKMFKVPDDDEIVVTESHGVFSEDSKELENQRKMQDISSSANNDIK